MLNFIITVLLASSAFATTPEKIGEITCNIISETEDDRGISADLYGKEVEDGYQTQYGDIHLTSYDRKNGTTTILKEWKAVPSAKGAAFALTLGNELVRLEAWFDDVGAMSSLTFEDEDLTLQCDVSFGL